MFDNIGAKLKALAKAYVFIGVVISFIIWLFVSFSVAEEAVILLSLLLIVGIGAVLSWLFSLFIYGFGELIEKTSQVAKNTSVPKE